MRRPSAYATSLNDAYIGLFMLDHPELDAPIFLTDAGADVTVGGDVYLAVPIGLVWPDDNDEAPPMGQLTLDSVSLTAIEAVRSISTPLTCLVSVVLASQPTIAEMGPCEFEVRNIRWTAITMTADLTYEPVLGVAYPNGTYNPADFPGMAR